MFYSTSPQYLCRKKSSDPIEKDFDVSTNVAYKEVNLKAKERASDYVEVILNSSCQSTKEDDKAGARSIKLGTSKSEASEYVDRADAM